MNSKSSLCDELRRRLRDAGANAVGFARAGAVDSSTASYFLRWLAEGKHGEMAFMERYRDIRLDPRLLLEGARSIICVAFNYRTHHHHSCIADYALGQDYHVVLRRRLQPVVDFLADEFGEQSRICVDSAPILERYWAVKAGVGFVGCNRQLIVPGVGSGVFLAEIVTTAELTPDEPSSLSCGDCGACRDVCPGGALNGDFDARLCRSYQTIEYRGDLPEPIKKGECVYGCDACRKVCPFESVEPVGVLEEFMPDPVLMSLTRENLAEIGTSQFRKIFAKSAIYRVSARKMRENCKN